MTHVVTRHGGPERSVPRTVAAFAVAALMSLASLHAAPQYGATAQQNPSTPLGTSPSTSLGTGPSTPLGTGVPTPRTPNGHPDLSGMGGAGGGGAGGDAHTDEKGNQSVPIRQWP